MSEPAYIIRMNIERFRSLLKEEAAPRDKLRTATIRTLLTAAQAQLPVAEEEELTRAPVSFHQIPMAALFIKGTFAA